MLLDDNGRMVTNRFVKFHQTTLLILQLSTVILRFRVVILQFSTVIHRFNTVILQFRTVILLETEFQAPFYMKKISSPTHSPTASGFRAALEMS